MRAILLALAAPLLLSAASSAPLPPRETIDQQLVRARAESAAAERQAAQLEASAARAGNEVARLRGEQAAAAAAIEAAEARISAADLALARARAQLKMREARLAARRAPVAGLLAGIANMGRQPPLLAVADGTSVEELVRIRALLDSTMPVIARRSATLAAQVRQSESLARSANDAKAELAESRALLDRRLRTFAALERRAAAQSTRLAASAFAEQEMAIAGTERVAELGGAAAGSATATAMARRLAALDFAAPRPGRDPVGKPILAYRLPANSPVIEGLGAISPSGVRSRGVRLATGRGLSLIVPADGEIVFAGPFRDYDGVVIIDHGGGWTSLLLRVATPVAKGARVRRGDSLGRSLGDIAVELRHRGQPVSAALIAGSSAALSNGGKIR